MKNNNQQVRSGGVGFLGALQIAFIVLKLCGQISWSWGVVLIPLILEVVLTVLALAYIEVLGRRIAKSKFGI